MSLLDLARDVERVVTDKTDEEILLMIDAAIADMRRVGIRDLLLDTDPMTPLAKMAVIFYVKANYGHDDSEHDKWQSRYRETVIGLMNSVANECGDTTPSGGLGASAP